MRAAIYPGDGRRVVIEERPDPAPGPGQILLKVHRCGICGTDLTLTRGGGGMMDLAPGSQFGHEYAGEIVELGRDVAGVRVGDRVTVLPAMPCGHCPACRSFDNRVLCQAMTGSAMVGFSELAVAPVEVVTRLPSTLSMADGALVEPMAIALYGVRLAQLRPGGRVLVLGGGAIALAAIYWARRLGAGRIVALSRSDRRRALCLEMGADAFLVPGADEIGEVAEALGGAPETVFECVGAEGMLGKALAHVGQLGRVVSLGFCLAPDPVVPAIGAYKCASIQFAVGYAQRDFQHVADQLDKGHCDPKAMISSEIALAALPDMLAHLRGPNEETKVHVRIPG